jgi:hypothetical protein
VVEEEEVVEESEEEDSTEVGSEEPDLVQADSEEDLMEADLAQADSEVSDREDLVGFEALAVVETSLLTMQVLGGTITSIRTLSMAVRWERTPKTAHGKLCAFPLGENLFK